MWTRREKHCSVVLILQVNESLQYERVMCELVCTADGQTLALCQLTPAHTQLCSRLCNGTRVLQHESLQHDVKQYYSGPVRPRAALC